MSLDSAFISHQIWLQRNASHEINELQPYIQEMRDETKRQILLMGDDNRTKAKLEAMLKTLEKALTDITDGWQDQLTDDLKELASYEADWTTKTLDANVDATFTTPSDTAVWAAAKSAPLALGDKPSSLFGMVEGWKQTEVNRLVMGVNTGFFQGLTTREIVKNVTGAGGYADVSARNMATVVRTAVNHVSTQAKETTYAKNSDIVEKYEWVSTLDSRTSTVCRSRDGQQYPLGKGPLPPAHPNCRSTTAPVISDGFDFLDRGGKRAAKGAEGGTQVDVNTTYYDFLKQQPAWFQDQALGPVRGKIFRNSGISPEEFRAISVDAFGRPLSLKEMAELDNRVAEYLKTL